MTTKRGFATLPPPGTRVQLTGYFLACTGQYAGSDGASRWLVQECACALCRDGFCAVNEPISNPEMYADVPEAQRPKWRHINLTNLQIVGKLPKAADMSDALGPIKKPLG